MPLRRATAAVLLLAAGDTQPLSKAARLLVVVARRAWS